MTVTRDDNLRQDLSPNQQTALALVLAGRCDREVAEEAGVSRQTIWRWRNEDVSFIAALNQERAAAWETTTDRLRTLNTKALDVVEQALDGSDTGAALALLRLLSKSLPEPHRFGPTSADEVAAQQRVDAAMVERDRELGRLLAST